VTAAITAEGLGIRFLFDRHRRLVTPGLARLRRRGTEVWGIRGLDLSIGSGEAVALLGPSGAGKTTLLRAIAGIVPADEGWIKVSGRVGSLLSIEAGLTPTLTGRENALVLATLVGLPWGRRRALLDDLRVRSGLGEAFERPVASFSQGMHAQLGFALVERSRPAILLLDEVHEALDHEFRRVVQGFSEELLAQGGVVVAAGHDHDLLSHLSDRALLLADGRIEADGPFDEIRSIAEGSVTST
jgi:ABC-type polysaccharide/polyol phosphate transport system ATPase subunit